MTESLHGKSMDDDQDLDVLDRHSAGTTTSEPPPSQNAGRPTVLLVAFVCIALLALNLWLVLQARAQEVRQLTLANEKLAGSIAQQIDSALLDVEHILNATVFELERGDLDPALLEHLQPAFVNTVANVAQLKGLFIYDAAGRWLLTSEATPNQSRNNSDRDYFKFHRDSPSREARLGLPIVSRSSGEWVVPLSRRLNDADGNFAGVALATVQLNYFKQALSRFKLGKEGATAIALNGNVIVRIPYRESDIGRDVRNQPIVKQAERQQWGSNEERSVLDQVVRIISFDHAMNYPVVTVVAVGRDEVLKDWFRASVIQTIAVLVLCTLVMTGGRFVLRSVRERETAEKRLREARDSLSLANDKLAHLALDDGLTGIPNRRFFDIRLSKLFANAQRTQQMLAVVMVDVDHFKSFNDRYGHVAGDGCLQRVAAAVRSAVYRPEDLLARYGGEELVFLLPDTDLAGARNVAERARAAVAELHIPHEGSAYGMVTISLGVAAIMPSPTDQATELVSEADRALYRAKESGRNRVC